MMTVRTSCPTVCRCLYGTIHCSQKGLTQIPVRIPTDSVTLILSQNLMDNTTIQRRNVSSFTNLENLYLSEMGIESIEVGAFTDLTRLRFLDLSLNKIHTLADYTFRGMSLSHLFLNGNRNINLRPNSFANLETIGLHLEGCSLSELDFDVFVPLNNTLKILKLNDNELRTIDRRFRPMILRLRVTHVALTSNPLHCDCGLIWLKRLYDEQATNPKIQPSCSGPSDLHGINFNELSLIDFGCNSPSIREISAIFNGNEGVLRCTASGDPTPTLYWIQPTGETVYRPSSDINESSTINEAVLNVTRNMSGLYSCVAQSSEGAMRAPFDLTWPSTDVSHTHTRPVTSALPPTSSVNNTVLVIISCALTLTLATAVIVLGYLCVRRRYRNTQQPHGSIVHESQV